MWRSCFHVREKRIGQGHFPLCGGCSLSSQSCLSPSSSSTHYSFHFSSSLLSFCSWPHLLCHRENRSQRVNSSLRAMPCVTTLHLHLPCSPCLLSQCLGSRPGQGSGSHPSPLTFPETFSLSPYTYHLPLIFPPRTIKPIQALAVKENTGLLRCQGRPSWKTCAYLPPPFPHAGPLLRPPQSGFAPGDPVDAAVATAGSCLPILLLPLSLRYI